jgi:hypothetical protein
MRFSSFLNAKSSRQLVNMISENKISVFFMWGFYGLNEELKCFIK